MLLVDLKTRRYQPAQIRQNTIEPKTQAHYQALVLIIKAMAHPTRLFIVDRLARGEKCVCKLTDVIGADMSTVSKHLSILKNAGIIDDQKRGVKVYYKLKVPCVTQFFGCVKSVIKTTAKEQLGLLKSTR